MGDSQKSGRRAAMLRAASTILMLTLVMLAASCSKQATESSLKPLVEQVSAIDWTDGTAMDGNLRKLDALRTQLEQVADEPDAGSDVVQAREKLAAGITKGLIEPVKDALERDLKVITGKDYLQEYDTLKTYLLLNDPAHVKEFGTFLRLRLVSRCMARFTGSKLPRRQLLRLVGALTHRYVELLESGKATGLPLDQALVASARDILTRIGPVQRLYDQLVTVLIDEKIDQQGPADPRNLKYAPVSLPTVFTDKPAALTVLQSKRKLKEGTWLVVRGPYTATGFEAVCANIDAAKKTLLRESWVVPSPGTDSRLRLRSLRRLEQDYVSQYIREWSELLRDIEVKSAANRKDRAHVLKTLSTPPWPYLTLLRVVEDHTVRMQLRGKPAKPRMKQAKPIRDKFASLVGFAIAKSASETPLSKYMEAVRPVAAALMSGSAPKLKAAEIETRTLLLQTDAFGQVVLSPLLLGPLGAR